MEDTRKADGGGERSLKKKLTLSTHNQQAYLGFAIQCDGLWTDGKHPMAIAKHHVSEVAIANHHQLLCCASEDTTACKVDDTIGTNVWEELYTQPPTVPITSTTTSTTTLAPQQPPQPSHCVFRRRTQSVVPLLPPLRQASFLCASTHAGPVHHPPQRPQHLCGQRGQQPNCVLRVKNTSTWCVCVSQRLP